MEVWVLIDKQSGNPIPCGPNNEFHHHNLLSITNTTFVNNYAELLGGGLYLEYDMNLHTFTCVTTILRFENCSFANNMANLGATVSVLGGDYFESMFFNCSFSNSSGLLNDEGALHLDTRQITFNNCMFMNNNVTAVMMYGLCKLYFNSSGVSGGAIAINSLGTIILLPKTSVKFLSNHAHRVGGAIYYGPQHVWTLKHNSLYS